MGEKYDALSEREQRAVDRQVALLKRDEHSHRRAVMTDEDRKGQLAAIPGNAKSLADMFEQIDRLTPSVQFASYSRPASGNGRA